MADISSITLPNGDTYNIKDATARSTGKVSGVKGNAESSYRTGNVNLTPANVGAIAKNETGNTLQLSRPDGLQGLADPTLQALVNTTRANRLAFLPADQIIIEKTTDGGTTWVDAGISDTVKTQLFSETRPTVALPRINDLPNILCGLRITVTGMKYNVPSGTSETQKYNYWSSTYVNSCERYCQLKEMYFWVSATNNSIGVKVERATGANPNSWSVIFNKSGYYMTGWSGCDYLKFAQSTFGGGTTQTGNYWNYRITLMTLGKNGSTTEYGSSTSAQAVLEIRGYGDTVWTIPNNYMANDHLYTIDYQKNATFPAKVTATQFNGALNGNASTATTATTATNVSGAAGTANAARHVWFSDSAAETKRAYDDDFKYNPSTNVLTVGSITGDAATVGGHTVGKNVPSDAVFTDTTYTFAEGTANGKFTVTPSGGSAQSVTIHGLGSLAFSSATIPTKTSDLTNDSGFVTTNTTYTFAEGTTNGAFKVTPSGGSAQTVTIHGLNGHTLGADIPSVSASDNGKVLGVSNGAIAAIAAPSGGETLIVTASGNIYNQQMTIDKTFTQISNAIAAGNPVYVYINSDGNTLYGLKNVSDSTITFATSWLTGNNPCSARYRTVSVHSYAPTTIYISSYTRVIPNDLVKNLFVTYENGNYSVDMDVDGLSDLIEAPDVEVLLHYEKATLDPGAVDANHETYRCMKKYTTTESGNQGTTITYHLLFENIQKTGNDIVVKTFLISGVEDDEMSWLLTVIYSEKTLSGIPSGGTAGQILKKNSSTNYDTIWSTLATSEITNDSGYIDSSSLPLSIANGGSGATSALGARENYRIFHGSDPAEITNPQEGDVYIKYDNTVANLQNEVSSLASTVSGFHNVYVEKISMGSVTTSSLYKVVTKSVAKTGYTPIGIVGFDLGNTYAFVSKVDISGTNAELTLRKTTSGEITVTPYVWVLYTKN